MIRNEKLTAIIPVRGGSKGVPRKNLLELGGRSILQRAIDTAIDSDFVDRVIVSTDDPEMNDVAARAGVAARNLRPAHLATDDALTIDVIADLMETENIDGGFILLLQTTCPLRTSQDLDLFCRSFEENKAADAIVSLAELQDPHPVKVQEISQGWVHSYLRTESMVPRQSLPPVYRLNGAFYLTHRETIVAEKTFMPERTIPFVMAPEKSVNLDTMLDFRFAEFLIQDKATETS